MQSQALGFKNKTCLFVLIASSWWLIHTIPLTFGNAHASAAPPIQSLLHVQGAYPPVPLPTFDSVYKLPGRTVRHIPVKDRLAFALALCSALRSALHDNSEDAWLNKVAAWFRYLRGSQCSLCLGSALDHLGHHAFTCKHGEEVVTRHNRLRDCILEVCCCAHIECR